MSIKLPLLISVPHGGTEIPPELEERCAISGADILYDSDAFTREIYDLKNYVSAFVDTPIARAFIDLNRAPDDLPPANPDGVVKTMTVDKKQIYTENIHDDAPLVKNLLAKYYYPYHEKLSEFLSKEKIQLALDCHSMLPISPPIGQDPGQPRPLICLSNGGDISGRPTRKRPGITCSPKTIQWMAQCFRKIFVFEDWEVQINMPFLGGHIIQSHQERYVEWIQVEINRNFYLHSPDIDSENLVRVRDRIAEIKTKLLDVFDLFFK